ncbi:MAG: hypothetical protein PCFJNLEI_00576 [Verrucomicrobiae bacterium]|nr:hypothetical protein [Verrucomicrobiae bacterium]
MPNLEVKEQLPLSFRRLLEISLGSIVYRLLRSAVTVAIIVLAIAFLAQIMMDGFLGRAARQAAQSRADKLAAYSRFLRQVSSVDADEPLVASFAKVQPDTAAFHNLRRWGTGDTARFIALSRQAQVYREFFDAIPLGRRVLLVQHQAGLAVFDWLAQPENYQSFREQLQRMPALRLPAGLAEFLTDWPWYRQQLSAVKSAYARVIAGVGDVDDQLAKQPTEFFSHLAAIGFAVDAEVQADILRGFEHQQRVRWAFAQLKAPPVAAGWSRQFQEPFSPGAALVSCAGSPARRAWVAQTLGGLDTEKFRAVASEYRADERLQKTAQELLSRYGSANALSERVVWLIVVSFLVCVVGIANAMLMSVLERFKEIATMKCLGARRQTIAFLFVTESVIVGVIGGIVGTVLGLIIVVVRHALAYGRVTFERFPTGDLALTFMACFCCSLLLAGIAAIYPALVAAKMAPMEAMRVE